MPWCLPLFFLGGTLQGIRSNSAPGPVSHLVSPAQPRSTAFPSLFLSAVGLHPPPPPCRAPRFSLFHAHAPFSQPSSSLLPHPSRAAGSHSQSSPHSFCASIERRFRLDVFPFILLLDLLGKARLVPFFFQPLFTLCALHVSLVRQQRRPPQEKHSLKHRQQRVLNTDSRPFTWPCHRITAIHQLTESVQSVKRVIHTIIHCTLLPITRPCLRVTGRTHTSSSLPPAFHSSRPGRDIDSILCPSFSPAFFHNTCAPSHCTVSVASHIVALSPLPPPPEERAERHNNPGPLSFKSPIRLPRV